MTKLKRTYVLIEHNLHLNKANISKTTKERVNAENVTLNDGI